MLTLFGALLGFFSSSFPDVLKFLNQKRDRLHELALMDKQIEMAQSGQSSHLEEIRLQTEAQEQVALYAYARPSRVKWVEALSSSVRPVITYGFFFLYAGVKVAQWHVIVTLSHLSWTESLIRIWNGEDEALFAAVMSFWFGHRALLKGLNPKGLSPKGTQFQGLRPEGFHPRGLNPKRK